MLKPHRRNGTLLAIIATACVAALASGACSSPPLAAPSSPAAAYCDDLRDTHASLAGSTLTVGTTVGQPKYDFISPDLPDAVQGIEPDLIHMVANCLDFTVDFRAMDFAGLVPALESGNVDLLAGAMYATPARAEKVDFVTYMKARSGVLVKAGNPKNLTTLSSLCGTAAAQLSATVENDIITKQSDECVLRGKPAISALTFSSHDQAASAVRTGRADFFMTDAAFATAFSEDHPSDYEFGFPVDTDFVFGIGVNKKSSSLRDALHDVLTAAAKDGQLSELEEKWGFSPEQALTPAVVS